MCNFFSESAEMRKDIHWEMGNCHDQLHQYQKAYESYQEALNEARKVHGDKPHSDIATLLMKVGQNLEVLGNINDAIKIHQEALDMKEKLFDEKKIPASDLAKQFNSLGSCQDTLGEYQ